MKEEKDRKVKRVGKGVGGWRKRRERREKTSREKGGKGV